MFWLTEKPSISTSSWFSVCSRSSLTAADSGAAMAADRVELVDEDDAGRRLLGLLEQVAHTAGADADEHLDEVGAGDREERDPGLAGDRAGEQRLAGAGRPVEQHALGDARAERLEAPRVGQELLDLLQLLDRLVHAGHVLEADLGQIRRQPVRLVLTEAHHLAEAARAAAHPSHHEDPDRREQQNGQQRDEDRGQGRAVARRRRSEIDPLALEQRLQAQRRLIARIVRLQHVSA